MRQISDVEWVCDEGKIFVDKETETILCGTVIQIGKIYKNGVAEDDDISNYVEIEQIEYKNDNETTFVKMMKSKLL